MQTNKKEIWVDDAANYSPRMLTQLARDGYDIEFDERLEVVIISR